MIKIEKTAVCGWDAAIRGMRNSYNSWGRSDSETKEIYGIGYEYVIGKNDLSLMRNLAKAGDDHSKFARMINVTCDITAPLYFYKHLDTYKVGTVANSCSTMHTIQDKEFTFDDFSYEHLLYSARVHLLDTIKLLNMFRDNYNHPGTSDSHKKSCWWQVIQLLPFNYNQKCTVQFNYQGLWNVYDERENYLIDEWKKFFMWIEKLPYFRGIYLED